MRNRLQEYKKILLPTGVAVLYCILMSLVFNYLYTNELTVHLNDLNLTTLGARLLQDLLLGAVFPLALIIFCCAKDVSINSFGLELSSSKAILVLATIYIFLFFLIGDKTFAGIYIWLYYLLFVACSEEIVFRGFVFLRIFNAFDKTTKGAVLGSVVSGLVWGIAHAIIPAIVGDSPFIDFALSRIGGGILVSAGYSFILVKSRTIFVPILIHATLDYMSVVTL